jgi:hypothetical protein
MATSDTFINMRANKFQRLQYKYNVCASFYHGILILPL